MNFHHLQENLRRKLVERITDGKLTALGLARQTGFAQPHITNFLNRKRLLSVEAMDRVLVVQRISVLDLLDPREVNRRSSNLPMGEGNFENVMLVKSSVAANEPVIVKEHVRQILKFKKNFLRRLRPSSKSRRDRWRRFVLIKVDSQDGMSMYPRLMPRATVLIDRHYNSLEPYRKQEQNMYAVRLNEGATVRYVELSGNNLVLRPHNQSFPVTVIPIGKGKTYADYIIGRICHVAIEV